MEVKQMKKYLFKFIFLMTLLICSFNVNAREISVTINGTDADFDSKPFIADNRTYVPMRDLFESIGALVKWDNASKSATATYNNTTISFKIGSNVVVKNGVDYISDSKSILIEGKTYVPIRIILELLGFNVQWDGNNNVDISTPSAPDSGPNEIPDSTNNHFELKVLELVNIERNKNGLSNLTLSENLSNVARMHSRDMYDRSFFNHTNPDGLSPFDRMKNYGISYKAAAENIAVGQSTPEQVVSSWMNSDGHRKNILNPSYNKIGIGYYNSGAGYVHYWTQCFTD